MNVLVAGGAGYIGSVRIEALLAAGRRAMVYDILSQGYRDGVAVSADFVRADAGDAAAERALPAPGGVGRSCRNPRRQRRPRSHRGGLTEFAPRDAFRGCGPPAVSHRGTADAPCSTSV